MRVGRLQVFCANIFDRVNWQVWGKHEYFLETDYDFGPIYFTWRKK